MSGTSNKALVSVLIGLVVGLFVGFVGGEVVRRDVPEAPRDASADSQTVETLRAMAESLAEVRRAVDPRFQREPSTSVVAPTPMAEPGRADVESKLSDTTARLAAVETKLDALIASVADFHADTLSGLYESGADLMPDELPEGPFDADKIERLKGLDMDHFTDEHLLWTYEQVLREYGRPTSITGSPTGGGIKFLYELPNGDIAFFRFHGGRLTKAFW